MSSPSPSPDPKYPLSHRSRSWASKFGDAFRGVAVALRVEKTFVVHACCALLVVVVATIAQVSAWQWCVLLFCITLVVVAEMFNTALESLARAITTEAHPEVRDALDMASGAVLLAAIGAVVIGALVLVIALV